MYPISRPHLSASLAAHEFAAWYWLKEELIIFCREHGISTSGTKPELQNRIIACLTGQAPPKPSAPTRRKARMPSHFTLETVIDQGWRCGPALGAFLRQVLGNGFHFNAAMRDFIHNGHGRTLADAAICYQNSILPDHRRRPIPRQLEYLQHLRDFFQQHPGASREQAIDAWWAKRGKRKAPA